MSLSPLQHAIQKERALYAIRCRAGDYVCLWPHGLQPCAYRQCATCSRVRHACIEYCRASIPNVQYARNITDIDDKIMRTAAELGEDISVLSQRYAQAYFEDMAALNNLEPTITPYATQHIPEMIDMIERLIAKEHAYVAEGNCAVCGAVYGRLRQAFRPSAGRYARRCAG